MTEQSSPGPENAGDAIFRIAADIFAGVVAPVSAAQKAAALLRARSERATVAYDIALEQEIATLEREVSYHHYNGNKRAADACRAALQRVLRIRDEQAPNLRLESGPFQLTAVAASDEAAIRRVVLDHDHHGPLKPAVEMPVGQQRTQLIAHRRSQIEQIAANQGGAEWLAWLAMQHSLGNARKSEDNRRAELVDLASAPDSAAALITQILDKEFPTK